MNQCRTAIQWAFRQKQLEIARILLGHGACIAHVSAWGWTPAFFLWPAPIKSTSSVIEYINAFGNDESIEWEVFDTSGWAVLHRAAAFGNGEEVEALIMYGANPTTAALPLRWTAIHHAVFFGNMDAFVILIDSKYNASVESPDARGWTLLHIAASAGHDAIVRHLLGLGANHHALSVPYFSHMPDELHGRCFMPSRAAAAQSLGRYEQYMNALKDFGLEERLPQERCEEEREDDEVYVDACESFYSTL
jgi:ankyrin repeat protein